MWVGAPHSGAMRRLTENCAFLGFLWLSVHQALFSAFVCGSSSALNVFPPLCPGSGPWGSGGGGQPWGYKGQCELRDLGSESSDFVRKALRTMPLAAARWLWEPHCGVLTAVVGPGSQSHMSTWQVHSQVWGTAGVREGAGHWVGDTYPDDTPGVGVCACGFIDALSID